MTFSWALSWRSKARRIMWRKAIERGCQCGGGKSKAGDRSIGESIPWAAEGGFVYALGLGWRARILSVGARNLAQFGDTRAKVISG